MIPISFIAVSNAPGSEHCGRFQVPGCKDGVSLLASLYCQSYRQHIQTIEIVGSLIGKITRHKNPEYLFHPHL